MVTASTTLDLAGDDLRVPVDIVTETVLVFGKRGSGKTSTGVVLAEGLIKAGLPVGVLDPKGDWWGLRSSADGKGPGLPALILGGTHGDLPLPPGSGALVANLLATERIPVVIDMKLLSKTQQRAFTTDFMERLYHVNSDPLHLIVDEADRFAPQRGDVNPRLLGAYEDIVLRGRGLGIGCTSITLRPAQLNSAIRSQVEILVAMKMLGKLDITAVDEWVKMHATDEEARELKASLPSLPVGTAWFWSPGWLEILKKVQVRPRLTFDSSATPKVGERRIVPREFAPLNPADLQRLGRLLGPPEPAKPPAGGGEVSRLTAEVTRLRAQLAAASQREPERVEVPVLAPGELAALEQAVMGVSQAAMTLGDVAGTIELALSRATAPPARPQQPVKAAAAAPQAEPHTDGDAALSRARRAILTVIAQFPEGRTQQQISMLTGYSMKSSGFTSALAGLRSAGLVNRGTPIRITAEGMAALGDLEPLPTGAALVEHWMSRLPKAERTLLRLFLDAYPGSLTKEEVSERSGYSMASSGLTGALGRLRTLELIHGWTADDTLAGQAALAAGS